VNALRRVVGWVTTIMDNFGAILVALIMVVTCIEVLMRYVLLITDIWSDALATHAYAWLALIGATVAVADDSNLGVRYFRNLIRPLALRRSVEILGSLAIIVFGYLFTSSGLNLIQVEVGQVGGLNVPFGVVYSIIVICGVIMLIFAVLRCMHLIMNFTKVDLK
jgi:TRAP-type C4-dicarboxylate transport system permease small subunit